MTKEEIEIIARIMLTADGGCGHCAHNLLQRLMGNFPQYIDAIKAVWATEYEEWKDDAL